MRDRTELWAALAVCIIAVGFTVLPFIVASGIASPPAVFSGFLLNPIDGFSYLAKMRQGWEGAWQFYLPYSADPGPPVYLFLFYLFLGHISSWLRLDLIAVFHAARVLGAVGMFFLAFLFFKRTLPSRHMVWFAFIATLVGSGLGWIATLIFGIQTSDIMIPESIPFLTAYVNAHFPIALMCILGAFLLVLSDGLQPGWRYSLSLICGLGLATILPFSVLSLLVALSIWLGWEWWRAMRNQSIPSTDTHLKSRTWTALVVLIGAIPVLLYDVWISQTHPVISAWTGQNITLSPPISHYLVGYGVLVLFALVSLFRRRPSSTAEGRLLLTWLITGALLLYAPIALQRRLNLGLFIPLAALASLGVNSVAAQRRGFWMIALVLLILTVPTNLLVIGAGLYGVRAGEGAVLHTSDELEAYQWIAANLPEGAVVLASPETGNRLPAFTSARVIYGHPFETPNADYMERQVSELFSGSGTWAQVEDRLEEFGVEYVFFGDRERDLGNPRWLDALDLLQEFGEVAVFKVPE